jgi:ATP-dependent helicase/nuclease subunit A
LQGFAAFLRQAAMEVKRDMDLVRDEVRVMTVHGAKGLEAPIVVLADTTTRPSGPRDPRILTLPRRDAPESVPECLVWATTKSADAPIMEAARQRARREAEDEYRRLLYVAMTRAAEHLIVCGAQGGNGKPSGCWYDLVHDALAADAIPEPAIDREGTVLRWRAGWRMPAASAAVLPEKAIEIPAWLSQEIKGEPTELRALSPSRSSSTSTRVHADRSQDTVARSRGRLAHRLLQSLPDLPAGERAEAARRYLHRAALEWTDGDREALLSEVLAVLGDSRFCALFGPDTRAEVPIRGRLGRNRPPALVAGQVDRLAVTDSAVLIADYKTDRPAPRGAENAPEAYVTQLALYRAILSKIYPGREIRAALLWTETLEFCELPAAALDAALARALDQWQP